MIKGQSPLASSPHSASEKRWFALYVWPRAEKKVFASLQSMGFEAYLPLITEIHQWSDRRKKVEVPLLRSYVFVFSSPQDHFNILDINGVLRFVSFENRPVVVPENQIFGIKKYIEEYEGKTEDMETVLLKEGQMVRIIQGPLRGLTGRLVSEKNKRHLIVYIETVGQYLPINIVRTKVEPLSE